MILERLSPCRRIQLRPAWGGKTALKAVFSFLGQLGDWRALRSWEAEIDGYRTTKQRTTRQPHSGPGDAHQPGLDISAGTGVPGPARQSAGCGAETGAGTGVAPAPV